MGLSTAALLLLCITAQAEIPFITKEEPNPGLQVQVPVNPHAPKPAPGVLFRLQTLPAHGTLYYDGKKVLELNRMINDVGRVTVDPDDGNVTVRFSYVKTDAQGNEAPARMVLLRFYDLHISGSVLYDFEGNGIIDGQRISNLDGEPLYITLINKEGEILASKAVSPEGRYSFSNADGIQPNSNYALVVSTKKNTLTSVLPETWGSSGENINSLKKGKDMHMDGAIVVKLREKDIKDVDFGLDVRPLAKSVKQAAELNPGGMNQVVVPRFEGSDKEDGKKVRFYILTLPNNAALYEDGKVLKKAGLQIKYPERLTLNPDNGDQNVTFTYVSVDTAGVTSHPATVEMPFIGLKISGNVHNDGNGDAEINGKGISTIEGKALYVTLLNDRDVVLASVSPESNGSFVFDGIQGIVPESRYTLVLSTKEKVRRSTLPSKWYHSSESIMMKKDSIKDGKIDVKVGTKSVHRVDFAVNKKPETQDIAVEDQLNPGSSIKVAIPALLGSDLEDPEKLIYTIETLPENATLYSAGEKVRKVPFICF